MNPALFSWVVILLLSNSLSQSVNESECAIHLWPISAKFHPVFLELLEFFAAILNSYLSKLSKMLSNKFARGNLPISRHSFDLQLRDLHERIKMKWNSKCCTYAYTFSMITVYSYNLLTRVCLSATSRIVRTI